MNFISFVRTLSKQDDDSLNGFIDFAKADNNFPNSSDPIKLAQYLYLQLSPDDTTGFQKMLMVYFQVETTNQIPPKYKDDQQLFLKAINYILKLQDNDPSYPFADLLPKNQ